SDRLCAARSLAVRHNIYLVGDMDNDFYSAYGVENGRGWLRLNTPGGKVCVAALPYPLESFLQSDKNADGDGQKAEEEAEARENQSADGEREGAQYDPGYAQKVKSLIDECALGFSQDCVNIFAAHLFMLPGSEEKTLGGAKILPGEILPSSADYVALGHVHKNMRAAKGVAAWYSGSLTPCSFTETDDRFVNLIEISAADEYKNSPAQAEGDGRDKILEVRSNGKKSVTVRKIRLESVKKLIRIEAKNYDEAKEKLCSCDGYAEIMYDCPTPLTSLQINALRSCPAFVKFTPCFNALSEQSGEKRKLMTDEQLFEAFFERKKGRLPDDDEKEAFFKAVRKEELL
ncbi:MAG: exonuclease SbcCD subunit D, partial [Candidatus Neoclostridium sp.]